jgi:predicted transcriptional regulator of viral defense system
MAEGAIDRIASVVADGHLHAAADFTAAGIHSTQLSRAVRAEAIVQYARGIYLRSWDDAVEHIGLAAVSLAHPGGVVCLGSAAQVHNLSNEDPPSVWYAVDRARVGRQLTVGPSVPVTTVFWPEAALTPGVEVRTVMGVEVRVTDAARTVIDLLRYRGKLGDEPGTKALTDYLRDAHGPINRLWDLADEMGCRRTVEPFLRFAEEVREAIPRPSAPGA